MTVQELLDAARQLSPRDRIRLASELMQLVSEEELSAESSDEMPNVGTDDPLIGLFSGSPNLATQAEEILQADADRTAGFTWKQS
ncbi:MAG: hypothetical protein AAFY11_13560 [Cyanobacteria bacterium J06641_5]